MLFNMGGHGIGEDGIGAILNGEGEHTHNKIITLHIMRNVVNVV